MIAPSARTTAANIDLGLLRATQEYLACRGRHHPPGPSLAAAWDEFYQTYHPLIRRLAVSCGVEPADLEDCVQEVWVTLVEKLATFAYDPRRGQFISWLYTLVHSKVADQLRRRNRHLMKPLRQAASAALWDTVAGPAAECDEHLQQEQVQHVLALLERQVPQRSYRVLQLRWLEGRTVAEVAAALELTSARVRLTCHRTKRRLRHLYELHTGKATPCRRAEQDGSSAFQQFDAK